MPSRVWRREIRGAWGKKKVAVFSGLFDMMARLPPNTFPAEGHRVSPTHARYFFFLFVALLLWQEEILCTTAAGTPGAVLLTTLMVGPFQVLRGTFPFGVL